MKRSDYYMILAWLFLSTMTPKWYNLIAAIVFGLSAYYWAKHEK